MNSIQLSKNENLYLPLLLLTNCFHKITQFSEKFNKNKYLEIGHATSGLTHKIKVDANVDKILITHNICVHKCLLLFIQNILFNKFIRKFLLIHYSHHESSRLKLIILMSVVRYEHILTIYL